MNLITNNLLQQGLNTNKLNIIVVETDNKQLKEDLLATEHNIMFVAQAQQIHTYIGYNFVLCDDFLTNAKQLQNLSRQLHLPICIYVDKPLPDSLTKVDINQIQKTIAPMMVIFENEELEKKWSEVTTDFAIFTKWHDIFDLMKTRVFTI